MCVFRRFKALHWGTVKTNLYSRTHSSKASEFFNGFQLGSSCVMLNFLLSVFFSGLLLVFHFSIDGFLLQILCLSTLLTSDGSYVRYILH